VARQNHLTFRDYQAAPRHRRIKAFELANDTHIHLGATADAVG
jgi:hypothetical protein